MTKASKLTLSTILVLLTSIIASQSLAQGLSQVEHIQAKTLLAYYPQQHEEQSANRVIAIAPEQWRSLDVKSTQKLSLKSGTNWFMLRLVNVSQQSELIYLQLGQSLSSCRCQFICIR